VLAISSSPLVDGFATNGIDLYILAKHEQIFPQPSGGAANDPAPVAGDVWPGPHVSGADFDGVNNRIKIPATAINSKDWHPDDDSNFTVTAQYKFDGSISARYSLFTTAEANFDFSSASYYGYNQGQSSLASWNLASAIYYDSYDKSFANSRSVVSLNWTGKNSDMVSHASYAPSSGQKWMRTEYKGFYDSATKVFTLDDSGEYLWQYSKYQGNNWSLGMSTSGNWTRFLSNEIALKTGGTNGYNQTIINSPGVTLASGQKMPSQLTPISGWSVFINGEHVMAAMVGTGSDDPMNYLGDGNEAYIGMRSMDSTFTSTLYGKGTDMNEWTLTSGLEASEIAALHTVIADGVDVRTWATANPDVTMRLYYPMNEVHGDGTVVKDFSGNGFDAIAEGMA
jgi:hypothetical protein